MINNINKKFGYILTKENYNSTIPAGTLAYMNPKETIVNYLMPNQFIDRVYTKEGEPKITFSKLVDLSDYLYLYKVNESNIDTTTNCTTCATNIIDKSCGRLFEFLESSNISYDVCFKNRNDIVNYVTKRIENFLTGRKLNKVENNRIDDFIELRSSKCKIATITHNPLVDGINMESTELRDKYDKIDALLESINGSLPKNYKLCCEVSKDSSYVVLRYVTEKYDANKLGDIYNNIIKNNMINASKDYYDRIEEAEKSAEAVNKMRELIHEMKSITTAKNLGDAYLFNMSQNYKKNIMDYIMKADRIDQNSPSCENLRYDITKRQITSDISQILMSKDVVLMNYQAKITPKALKVFVAKDIKNDKSLKIFIDCSDFSLIDGQWTPKNLDVFTTYLLSAMVFQLYYTEPNKLVMNSNLMSIGRETFAILFTYIIDYIFKIGGMDTIRSQCMFLAAVYFSAGICKMPITETVINSAKSISKIDSRRVELLSLYLKEDSFDNINVFIDAVAKALKLPKLTIDVFVEKWIYIYGPSTIFSLELLCPFSSLLTDAYMGTYVNQQQTIEKVVGNLMIEWTKSTLAIIKNTGIR